MSAPIQRKGNGVSKETGPVPRPARGNGSGGNGHTSVPTSLHKLSRNGPKGKPTVFLPKQVFPTLFPATIKAGVRIITTRLTSKIFPIRTLFFASQTFLEFFQHVGTVAPQMVWFQDVSGYMGLCQTPRRSGLGLPKPQKGQIWLRQVLCVSSKESGQKIALLRPPALESK